MLPHNWHFSSHFQVKYMPEFDIWKEFNKSNSKDFGGPLKTLAFITENVQYIYV